MGGWGVSEPVIIMSLESAWMGLLCNERLLVPLIRLFSPSTYVGVVLDEQGTISETLEGFVCEILRHI